MIRASKMTSKTEKYHPKLNCKEHTSFGQVKILGNLSGCSLCP
jgi:hypothetical protein